MRALILFLAIAFSGIVPANAQVVALGDSATRGYLLDISEAWPAKLEGLLHARNVNVSVANAGVNGDTSEGMLARMDEAIPAGTRVVILMCCGNDNKDKRHFVADHLGNVTSLVTRLRNRGIAVIYSGQGGIAYGRYGSSPFGGLDEAGAHTAKVAGALWCGWAYQGLSPGDKEPSPAGEHPTPTGHDKIAARILPCVLQALAKRR